MSDKITQTRCAGILMPMASLPSHFGIGSMGREARQFVNLLAEMGVRIWQILPLNPLGFGNSPYQPFSSYAGDELYIDLELLVQEGLLPDKPKPFAQKEPDRVDYQAARSYKEPYLRDAFDHFKERGKDARYAAFLQNDWVYNYAVFAALKAQNGMRCWVEWPLEQQNWILDGRYDLTDLQPEIDYRLFTQYIFYRQWMALKAYANAHNVLIMGDIPFYVGLDSLDVWGAREQFLLMENGEPAFIAGVPPDYFSPTGQRWGNPIYDWEKMRQTDFTFWVNRLKYSCKLYDLIRIDHFRAFDTYWKIPASCATAIDGEWVEAPGYELFDEIYRKLPDIEIVAEDLGDLRPEVLKLRDHYGLLGMNVLEFTLLDRGKIQEAQLAYSGTHDNQTVRGWYKGLTRGEKGATRAALSKYGVPWEAISRKMLRYIFHSEARVAIVPLADVLDLDDHARLNVPGTLGSPNWEWRLDGWQSLRRRKAFVQKLIADAGR